MGRNEGAGLLGSFPASDAKEHCGGPNSVLSGAKAHVLGAVQARVDVIPVELTIQDASSALSLRVTASGLGVCHWSRVYVTCCHHGSARPHPPG